MTERPLTYHMLEVFGIDPKDVVEMEVTISANPMGEVVRMKLKLHLPDTGHQFDFKKYELVLKEDTTASTPVEEVGPEHDDG